MIIVFFNTKNGLSFRSSLPVKRLKRLKTAVDRFEQNTRMDQLHQNVPATIYDVGILVTARKLVDPTSIVLTSVKSTEEGD